MKNKMLALVVACLGLMASQSHAALQRLQAWGRGPSEFEAVKSAYKQIAAEALKIAVARAGTSESSLRQFFIRDIEEDLLRMQQTYFAGAAAPQCTESGENFECLVVVQAQMDEIEGKIRSLLDVTGSGAGSVHGLRIALMSRESNARQQDLTAWLHSELEGDFGHDVYRVDEYVEAGALRNQCAEYDALIKSTEARGSGFRDTAAKARRAYATCKDLLDRDLIIMLESAESRHETFNSRERSMAGELTLRMQLLQTKSRRPLPAPRPQAIKQYGYGDTAQMAESDLRDRLYNAVANYVSQQMNATLVNSFDDGRVKAEGGEREYQVAISGVNTDTPEGRAHVALVRDWFAGQGGRALEADAKAAPFGERIYRFRSSTAPNWTDMMDQLQVVLDKAGADARLDVDSSRNLRVAFQNKAPDAKHPLVTVKHEDRRIRRAVVVESQAMKVRRRDPESGVAIAVNEAELRILNKSRNDLLIDVKPVWTGQDGSSLPAPYNYRQILRLPAKTSERFTIMAPSRFARSVTLEISCLAKACKVVE